MKILHVCSELYPLLKTGGLADVMGALPFAQQQAGMDVRVVLPAYPAIAAGVGDTVTTAEFDSFAGHATLRYGRFRGLGIYLIDAPHLFAREGNPYHDAHYRSYADNYLRFALLGWVGADLACGLDHWWRADVVHAHDWHAGLAPAYLAAKGRPAKSVFTIHNLAYTGSFDARHLAETGLPFWMFDVDGLELYGQLSYLKAGLYYADAVTAVSPTYAEEITRPEYGCGLQGLLAARRQEGRLQGILNGVDGAVWNPAADPLIAAKFGIGKISGKKQNKADVQARFGLQADLNAPLFAMVTRLTDQKGVDLLLENAAHIAYHGGQLAVIGSGEARYENWLRHLAAEYPGRIGADIGYNEALSHRLIAGADVIAVPSRFEPCGLTQLYGLKYGTLPLVRRTGGLADTVVHADAGSIKHKTATGFVFDDADVQGLRWAIDQAFALWRKPHAWAQVRNNAMRQDFSWAQAAASYKKLYSQPA